MSAICAVEGVHVIQYNSIRAEEGSGEWRNEED
jgi:hypothetical protein